MWYSTPQKQKTPSEKAYEACDKKDINLIKKCCPEVQEGGLTWYDTTGQYVEHEVKYLRLRGLVIIHPNHVLVRFKE